MNLRCLALPALLLISNLCGARDFCAHADTNGLAWDKEFQASVGSYFGGQKLFLFWNDATIADQVRSGLGGPPDPVTRIDENTVIASACRQHSCPEKVAVIIQCPAKIAAVGVIHYCSADRPGCDEDKPQLTLFSEGADQRAHAPLKQWAAQALGAKSGGMRVRVRSPLVATP